MSLPSRSLRLPLIAPFSWAAGIRAGWRVAIFKWPRVGRRLGQVGLRLASVTLGYTRLDCLTSSTGSRGCRGNGDRDVCGMAPLAVRDEKEATRDAGATREAVARGNVVGSLDSG